MFVVAAVRARPQQGPLEVEWAAHRSEIKRRYIMEDESLDDIMREMGTKYSFHATYTTNFSLYGLSPDALKEVPIRTTFQRMGAEKKFETGRMADRGHSRQEKGAL